MGRRTSKDVLEHWRLQVELYESSGQTREAFSAAHGMKVYTLDYWRRKLSRPPAVDPSGAGWIPLKIVEDESSIELSVGKVRIAVKPGFNRELLSEVLRVLSV